MWKLRLTTHYRSLNVNHVTDAQIERRFKEVLLLILPSHNSELVSLLLVD